MHISQRGSEQALVGKAVIFMKDKEVFKIREWAEKGRVRVEEEREKRDAGFLNGGVFASLILRPI